MSDPIRQEYAPQDALKMIARGDVPTNRAYFNWHDKYQALREFAASVVLAQPAPAPVTVQEAARLRHLLIEATAELIYLRKYAHLGGRWEANESKDVWRDYAIAALADPAP